MILGTAIFRIVRMWWFIIKEIIMNPAMIFKVGFLWLSMSFAGSYIFFLLVHKHDVVRVRKDLAVALGRSFFMGFFVATMLIALYQFILGNFIDSKFLETQQNFIASLHIFATEFVFLYQGLCFLTIILSGLFATHYVGEILDEWHEAYISNRYGWSIMAVTLLCWGFLWGVNYVI